MSRPKRYQNTYYASAKGGGLTEIMIVFVQSMNTMKHIQQNEMT